MVLDPQRNFEHLLREGINAVKRGNKNLAWSLLHQAAQADPLDARPWLWLTEIAANQEEKKEYLVKALAVDPGNAAARRGLLVLTGKLDPSSSLPIGREVSVQPSEHPLESKDSEVFLCPQCGAQTAFKPKANALTCSACGFASETEVKSAADQEQLLDLVLPTKRGHLWAASQSQLSCEQCGAQSLWPPGQTAAACPHCGSNQLIENAETEELVDPQGIALMQIDKQEAARRVAAWLQKGWTTPDDLKAAARKSPLRPAYYPFWTFDGTAGIKWMCEVNEGTNNRPHWVIQSGTEYEMFDDVLIPGLASFSFKDLRRLSPFRLKDIVEFKPEHLAGWPAFTYNRPLAKATLLAREQVIRKLRPQLHSRVLPGITKRGLTTGDTNWSDMTFKLILLPVWVGNYRYKGENYKIMVNGQTGKVAGEKPRDAVKLIGILSLVVVTTLFLLIIIGIITGSMGQLPF